MPSPFLPDRAAKTFAGFNDLTDDFVIAFDPTTVGLLTEKDNGEHRIYDIVDDVYVEGVKAGLGYREVQVLAAMALIHGSETQTVTTILPGDRRPDA